MLTEYLVEVELTEPLLGTVPKDREVYASYVQTKAPVENPDETPPEMDEVEEKGWTGFYTDSEGRPVLMDYQIKGFIKEAGNTLKDSLAGAKFPALKSHVDNELFVFPRRIALLPEPEVLPVIERPLRAMTMKGPRVTLMRSDVIPEGTKFSFEIKVLPTSKITKEILEEILEYGSLKGLGQWRNGSYGRFIASITEV